MRVPSPVVTALVLAAAVVVLCGCGKSEEDRAADIPLQQGAAKSEVRKLADKGLPHLKELLESDSQITRMTAMDAMGYLKGNDEAVEALLEMTRSEHPMDVSCALLSLARLGAPQTKELILKFIEHDNPELREGACVAIGVYGDKSLYPLLDRALRDDNPRIQQVAATIKEKYVVK